MKKGCTTQEEASLKLRSLTAIFELMGLGLNRHLITDPSAAGGSIAEK